MFLYLEYFTLTLVLSTLFALGGVGSATALVPLLNMMGLPFGLSKALGLFVNSSSTIVATIMNLKRKVLDVRFAFPLAVSLMLFTPVGAYLSQYVDEKIMKWMLAGFLFFSASMMLFGKKEAKVHYEAKCIQYLVGSVVGLYQEY